MLDRKQTRHPRMSDVLIKMPATSRKEGHVVLSNRYKLALTVGIWLFRRLWMRRRRRGLR